MGDGTLRTGRFSDRRRSRQRSGRVPDRSRDGHRPPHTARHGATLRDRIGHEVPLEPPTRSTISATTSVSNSDETLDLARPLDVPAGVTRDKGAYRLADLQRTRAPLRNDDHPPTRRMLLDGNWQSISPLRWPRVRASLVCERHRRTAGSREPELRRPDTLRVLSLLPFYPLVKEIGQRLGVKEPTIKSRRSPTTRSLARQHGATRSPWRSTQDSLSVSGLAEAPKPPRQSTFTR